MNDSQSVMNVLILYIVYCLFVYLLYEMSHIIEIDPLNRFNRERDTLITRDTAVFLFFVRKVLLVS